ncbi:hypothetical protein BM1_08741 [Bipolaris maydis]|nr:hypothetical protein BM1_08741 [Bipolaris maydis]
MYRRKEQPPSSPLSEFEVLMEKSVLDMDQEDVCWSLHKIIYIPYPSYQNTNKPPTNALIPRPSMIPPLPRRKIRLHPRILDRHTPPDAPLKHSTTIQPADVPALDAQPARIRALAPRLVLRHPIPFIVQKPQVLARSPHAVVLALQLAFFGRPALAQEEQPRAVDGPVPQRAVARKV